jgi:hypothetical protein
MTVDCFVEPVVPPDGLPAALKEEEYGFVVVLVVVVDLVLVAILVVVSRYFVDIVAHFSSDWNLLLVVMN